MMRSKIISINSILFAFLLVLCGNSHAARILGYFPSSSKSHLLIHCAIAETLASAGHDVTVLGAGPNLYKNAKYKYINIGASISVADYAKEIVNNPQPIYKGFGKMMDHIMAESNESTSHSITQNFLRENGEGSFDLLILGYFMNEFHLGLGGHFKCPIIISFMIQPIYSINKFISNPSEAAYVPTLYSGVKQPMNFLQRVKNFISIIFDMYLIDVLISSRNAKLYDYHFPASKYPSLDEVAKNVSLLFSNHHSNSQGPIRPNVPAIVEIGGIQIKEKPGPLPKDIADILDNSAVDVIYFSLGTNINGDALSKPIAQIMFNVLSKLPYKVLWKWGDSEIPGTSANIIFKSWLPQNDILPHPKVKLFITHAGQGSVVESQYHGVPMVAIPLFADQPSNAANLQNSGFGVQLDYLTLTEEKFRNAILEVLNNPKYAKAVRNFSNLYRDRTMTPRQMVVYWTEYILRHNGAKHLQSPAVHMNQLQLLSLDVLAFLAAILFTVIFILVKFCKMICCRRRTSPNKAKSSAAQKKKVK